MTYRTTSRTRRTRPVLRLALVGLVLAAVVARAEIIEQVLVKVNGEILTKTELENRQVQALRAERQIHRAFDRQRQRRAPQGAERNHARVCSSAPSTKC